MPTQSPDQAKANSTIGGLASSYTPPKDWDDITSDEKIERLRDVIKGLQQQVGQSQVGVHNLRQKLMKHEHKDGKVYEMKEIQAYDDSNGLVGIGASLSNAKFF